MGSGRTLRTGWLSPVRLDSSTVEAPEETTPSRGTCAPGFTLTRVPTATPSTGFVVSSIRVATCGFIAITAAIAERAFSPARVSSS